MKSDSTIDRLKNQFAENINSHVFLVETNNLDLCLVDIKSIIKDKLNASSIIETQIDEENYLEQIIIRPDGKEIKKDQILELQERIKTKPVLSDYIFYILTPAETLSEISSNKLLKTIEEPNENVIGFLLTTNSDLIISTIKSRCEYIKLVYDEKFDNLFQPDENILNTTKELIQAIEEKNHIKFTNTLSEEKKVKDNYKNIENLIKDYYNMACSLVTNNQLDETVIKFLIKNNTRDTLVKKSLFLNRFQNKLNENMNGYLTLETIYFNLKEVN